MSMKPHNVLYNAVLKLIRVNNDEKIDTAKNLTDK